MKKKAEKISGIYMIKCLANNKVYIGLSRDIKTRWSKHKNTLKRNKHDNLYLQHAYNKYGAGQMEYTILDLLPDDEEALNEKEKEWIKFYKSNNREFGYNKTDGGDSFKLNEELIRRGEEAATSKLTEKDVLRIIERLKNGEKPAAIAEEYSVVKDTIHMINRGENWSHLTNGERVNEEWNFNRGEDHPQAKLTRDDVLNIVDMLESGVTIPKIAKQYDVHRDTIWEIRDGVNWNSVTGGKVNKKNIPLVGEEVPSSKLTENQVKQIIQMYKDNVAWMEIRKKFSIAHNTLWAIVKGETWKHITGGEVLTRPPQNVTLTKEKALQAIEFRKQSVPLRKIAEYVDAPATTIFYVLNGETWKELTGGKKIVAPNVKEKITRETAAEIADLIRSGIDLNEIAETYGLSYSHIKNIRDGHRWKSVTGGKIIVNKCQS